MSNETAAGDLELKDVISAIAEKTGFDKGVVQGVLDQFKTLVADAMVDGRDVKLGRDFGTFTTIAVKGRNFFVPATGETVAVGARRKMRFQPSPARLRNLS